MHEFRHLARRIGAVDQVGAQNGGLFETEEHVERLGIHQREVSLIQQIDDALQVSRRPGRRLAVRALVGGGVIGSSLAVGLRSCRDVVIVQVPSRRRRRQQTVFGRLNRRALHQRRPELLPVETTHLGLHLRGDGLSAKLPVRRQQFPGGVRHGFRCRQTEGLVARGFENVLDQRGLRSLQAHELALGGRAEAVASAGVADPGHHADGHQRQRNEGGNQFRLNAQGAGVWHVKASAVRGSSARSVERATGYTATVPLVSMMSMTPSKSSS